MASSLHAQLTLLRMSARTEREKGRLFEQLMAAFLRTEPQYAEMFDQVWLWEEWPDRPGPDCGIDIVASLADGSGLAAIQCKFYDPDHQVSKRDVDTFLAESGRHKFAWRLIVATTDKWNTNADDTIADQQIPVGRLGLAELEEFRTDWAQLDWGQPERLELSTIKSLRKHQHEAIDAVMKGLAEHDRGKLVMACGTGKTFTSLKLVEKMVGAGGSVLFLVPSISLLSQTYREWMAESAVPINAVPVCSDGKATSGGRKTSRANRASEEMTAADLAVPVSTDSDRIAAKLRAGSASAKSMTVVFSTYQSIQAVRQAQHAAGPRLIWTVPTFAGVVQAACFWSALLLVKQSAPGGQLTFRILSPNADALHSHTFLPIPALHRQHFAHFPTTTGKCAPFSPIAKRIPLPHYRNNHCLASLT